MNREFTDTSLQDAWIASINLALDGKERRNAGDVSSSRPSVSLSSNANFLDLKPSTSSTTLSTSSPSQALTSNSFRHCQARQGRLLTYRGQTESSMTSLALSQTLVNQLHFAGFVNMPAMSALDVMIRDIGVLGLPLCNAQVKQLVFSNPRRSSFDPHIREVDGKELEFRDPSVKWAAFIQLLERKFVKQLELGESTESIASSHWFKKKTRAKPRMKATVCSLVIYEQGVTPETHLEWLFPPHDNKHFYTSQSKYSGHVWQVECNSARVP